MVLSAKLHIKGHKSEKEGISLMSCDYHISQSIDNKGLANSIVQGGVINLSFISIDDNELIQWMISEEEDRDGKILFIGDSNSKPFRTLEFKDARLISYNESFSDQSYMITSLSISVRQFILQGIVHTNAWLGYEGAGNGSSSS
jgi:hypothetical protein